MELTYTKVGDYYFPNLALDDDTEYEIGRYGQMHWKYLEECHPILWNQLVLTGKLWKYLSEIDTICNERMDCIISVMKEREGVTEALKAADQMEWMRCINSIRNRVEEIVLAELVFT